MLLVATSNDARPVKNCTKNFMGFVGDFFGTPVNLHISVKCL